MKKLKNILFSFICLFLLVSFVYAEEPYELRWDAEYRPDYATIFLDAVGLNDGNVSIGYGQKEFDGTTIMTGVMVKYDGNGEEVWVVEEENAVFLDAVRVDDGFVVLENSVVTDAENVFLTKYDSKGNVVWKEKISDEKIEAMLFIGTSINYYDGLIGVAFNDKVFLYDESGQLVKQIINGELSNSVIEITDDGVYVVGFNSDEKSLMLWTFDLNGKYINKAVGISNVSNLYSVDFEIIDGYGYWLVFGDGCLLVKFDFNKLELIDFYDVGSSILLDIEEVRNGILLTGIFQDEFPTGKVEPLSSASVSDVLSSSSEEIDVLEYIEDVKAISTILTGMIKVNLDLEFMWGIEYDYWGFESDSVNDSVFVAGMGGIETDGTTNEKEYGMTQKYTLPVFDLNWSATYTDTTRSDEYFYDVVGYEGGSVAVGIHCANDLHLAPLDAIDAKDIDVAYGCSNLMTRFDKDGNVVWSKMGNDISIYHRVVKLDDGFVAFGYIYSDGYKNVIVKHDLNGNVVWTKDVNNTTVFNDEGGYSYRTAWKIGMSSYDNMIGLALGNGIYFYDKDGNVLKEVLLPTIECTDVDINEKGIYVIGLYEDDSTFIGKFDFDFNYVNHNFFAVDDGNFIYYPSAIDYVHGNIVVAYSNNLAMFDENLNKINEITLDYEYAINDITETLDGFATVGGVSTECGLGCGENYFIDRYDMNMNKVWSSEISYQAYGIDDVSDGFVTAGYVYYYDDPDDGVSEKYKYYIYDIAVKDDGNGTVTASKISSVSGELIEFTVEPKDGYQLKRVIVTTESGEVLEFTDYKFTMPSENVEIYAEFELISNPNTGINSPIVICGIISLISFVGYKFLKKKKYI